MKIKLIGIGILLFLFQINSTLAQTAAHQSVADKIVNQVLEVQPGEVVMITGTPAEVEMMEDYVVAVAKAGGQAFVSLDLPAAYKKAMMETSIDHLKIPNTFRISLIRNVDCFINLGSVQDPQLLADVPEDKLAASREAGKAFTAADKRAHYRGVEIGQTGGIPSKAYATSVNADHQQMLDMFWKSINVDYSKMAANGKQVATLMKAGSQVKLTSTYGTNLQFSIGKSDARINSGRTADNKNSQGPSNVWLPAGEAYVAINPASANGTMVVPAMDFRGSKIKNLKMTYKAGKMVSMSADSNIDALKKAIEMSKGDVDVLSLIDIGLNQNSHSLPDSDYASWEMAGMVTLAMGNNGWTGGNVDADGAFTFHLPKSTLSIDGKTIVSNGELQKDMLFKK
ncbi:MAG: leucyl aminopeptidase (aminopeptidase T) [Paraglaciecola sp.]|jgi:leucyl aminopeptidase (aminopeptidase T)